MSWFKKKEFVEEQITKYYVPEDQIMGLLEAFDGVKKNDDKVSRYLLWKKISIVFPYLDIKWGSWEFVVESNSLCPHIIEVKGGVQI